MQQNIQHQNINQQNNRVLHGHGPQGPQGQMGHQGCQRHMRNGQNRDQ